jgi:hypothetical protein
LYNADRSFTAPYADLVIQNDQVISLQRLILRHKAVQPAIAGVTEKLTK